MKLKPLHRLRSVALAASLCLVLANPADAAEPLIWRADQEQVDAEIESWDLSRTLEAVAATTGWEVFVEPETEHSVSTRFRGLKPVEALRRLLGDLNFAVLPQTNGPPRLFVYRRSVDAATRLVQAPRQPGLLTRSKPIPNELIVTLKPGSAGDINELARKLRAKVRGSIDGLDAYRLEFESAEAAGAARALLEQDEDVASIDQNFAITPPSHLEPLTMSSAPPPSLKINVSTAADRLVIGLVDTPVQGAGSPVKELLLPSLSLAGAVEIAPGQFTHGTAMAETVMRGLALAPQESGGTTVRILPVDVYGANANTSSFDVARGIYAAINAGATIINLSLGSDGSTPFLQRLIQDAHKQGVLFVGSAGNEPVTTPVYPAAFPEVLAVTAGDKRGRIASYANRGDFVDVVAPGANIVHYGNQSFLGSGTSFATAYVSGLAAGIAAARPGTRLAEVDAELRAALAFKPAENP